MKANGHLDEGAANLLLDRATFKRDNGSLDFSRDIKVKITVKLRKFRLKENLIKFYIYFFFNLIKMSTRDHYRKFE